MLQASLPDSLWAEAVNTATYLRNRCATKCLDGITPFEAWTQQKPYVGFFRTIESKTIALNKNQRGRKFQPKGDKYLLVGYSDESKAYRLWKPGTKTIIKARDVKFFERIENSPESSTGKVFATPYTFMETSDEEMRNEDTEDEVRKDPQGAHDENTGDELEENEPRRGPGRPRITRTGKPGRPRKIYRCGGTRRPDPSSTSQMLEQDDREA